MRKQILIIILSALFPTVYSQTTLTLEGCKQKAVDNYPLIKEYKLISLSEEYTMSNLSKSYLPQLALNGQATYQSEVTKIPIDFSALNIPVKLPAMGKDQYKATIEATQLIWDGGTIKSQKEVTKANTDVSNKKIDVELHTVKKKINDLYFGILTIDEQLKILDLNESEMRINRNLAISKLNNGVAMQSDIDQIDVELLNIDQKRTEQTSTRTAYIKMLGLFIHEELDDTIKLEKPQEEITFGRQINRPELSLYDSQRTLYKEQNNTVNAKNMPQIGLYAQGGYGRPGLNMLEDKFKFFAIGGIKLNWNIGNLYTKKNEKRLNNNNITDTNIQQEVFIFNTNVQLTQEQEEIAKLKKLISKDDDIIKLQTRVKMSTGSKYKNGVSEVNDLIRDTNAESQARQTKALHQIQYLISIYNYKHIQGN